MVTREKQHRRLKLYKKGCGLTFCGDNSDTDVLEFEEELLQRQDKKLKKHYLKSDAKAFIHKFIRSFRSK